jgi:hypothetical protein
MGRKKKLPHIEVRTVANGYTLAIEGHKQEYLYFSPEKLMEGVMVHVGLKMNEQLSPDTIKSFIDSALEWNNLKASHKELNKAKRETERVNKLYRSLARRMIEERRRVLRLCKLAKDCVTGHHSLTDALAALHARAHLDGQLKEFTLKDFGITSDDILICDNPQDDDDEDADDTTTAGR